MRLPGPEDARRPADFIAKDDLLARVREALADLYRYDGELLSIDVQERTICHRLAIYLERRFPYWHVDCEYNRNLVESKRRGSGRPVVPDIIVHRRLTDENLLAVEIKKSGTQNSDDDVVKLVEYVSGPLHYAHGLLLRLDKTGIEVASYWACGRQYGEPDDVTQWLDSSVAGRR